MHRHYWQKWDLELLGSGRAFEESCYALPRQQLALDGGWGRGNIFAQPNLFISHLHMDHALGIARYVVNRQKMGDGSCRIFAPATIIENAQSIIAAWQKAEGRKDPIDWIPVNNGDTFHIEGPWVAHFFDVPHTIPAGGVLLKRKSTRVKPEFAGLPSKVISQLIREGKEPVGETWDSVFAYCGDTGIDVLDTNPELYDVKILLLECTFIGEFHPDKATKYGHVQWEDIISRKQNFNNEAILLTHFSKRYQPDKLWRHINDTCPEILRKKIRPMIVPAGTDDRRD